MFEWNAFHFIRPYWLFALLPIIALIIRTARQTLGQSHWQDVCDKELLPYLLDNRTSSKQYGHIIAISIASILTVLALAGPTWHQLPYSVFHNNSALVIALDLSRSMDANDIKPSRLIRARYKIVDILNKRKDGLTALLVYAGDAYTVTPLTDDVKTIKSQLNALNTNIMPVQGSNTEAAINSAVHLLQQAGQTQGGILLITDEVNTSQIAHIHSRLGNFHLSVFGVGTSEGAPIPVKSTNQLIKDNNGNIVVAKLDETALRTLAQAGHGMYKTIQNNDADIDAFLSLLDKDRSSQITSETKIKIEQWDDKGPWLLLLVLPFAALYFRKGLLVVPLLLFLHFPQPSYAFSWQDLWKTPDQQGQELFDQQRYKEAEQAFQSPQWKAAAQYKAGDYEQAKKTLEPIHSADAYYNQANALAKSGKLKEAIDTYQKALDLAPDHQDAIYNKKLVEQALKDQHKQQQDKNDTHQNDSDQNKQSDKNNNADQQSDSKEQQQQQQQQQQQDDAGKQNKEQNSASDQQQHAQNNDEQQNKKSDPEQHATDKQTEQDNQKKQEQEQSKSTAEKQNQSNTDKKSSEQGPINASPKQQPSEKEQANAQWLQRIPDDPSGLLKRKFKYQYSQRKQIQQQDKSW